MARRGPPRGATGVAVKFIAREGERELEVEVQRHGAGYRVRLGDRWIEADLASVGKYVQSLRLDDGTQHSLVHHRSGTTHEISMDGGMFVIDIIDPLAARRSGGNDEMSSGGIVKAMMPGRVVRVLVNKGDTVTKGTGLLILEAMKMENEISAPADGVVDELFVEPGQTVEAGAELVHIA